MPTVEERLAGLEGRMNEQSQTFTMMRDTVLLLRESVASLERRVDRFEQRVDGRFDAVDRRFEGLEARLGALDDKMSNRLGWVIGLFIASTIAIIAAILARR